MAISSDDYPDEFALLRLTTNAKSAILNFEIIANCAQNKRGVLSVSGDTLTIDKTNMAIAETTRYEKLDSAGNVIEIIEETTHIGDVAFCDCLVNFYYELSTSLENTKFLTQLTKKGVCSCYKLGEMCAYSPVWRICSRVCTA